MRNLIISLLISLSVFAQENTEDFIIESDSLTQMKCYEGEAVVFAKTVDNNIVLLRVFKEVVIDGKVKDIIVTCKEIELSEEIK